MKITRITRPNSRPNYASKLAAVFAKRRCLESGEGEFPCGSDEHRRGDKLQRD